MVSTSSGTPDIAAEVKRRAGLSGGQAPRR
jgi:hypothetical protein